MPTIDRMTALKTFLYRLPIQSLLVMSVTTCVYANGFDETIENALKLGQSDGKYGQVIFDLNYRYEHANTEGTRPEPANANTFRLRLGYLSPNVFGWQGFAEYENVFAAQRDYNGVSTGNSHYHVVADPADRHELNQLWLSFNGIPDTLIKGGRAKVDPRQSDLVLLPHSRLPGRTFPKSLRFGHR